MRNVETVVLLSHPTCTRALSALILWLYPASVLVMRLLYSHLPRDDVALFA